MAIEAGGAVSVVAAAASELSTSDDLPTTLDRERTSIAVAALVDTNVLVYRFDHRFPVKQPIATDILRRGIAENSVRLPHQAIVEFVAAVTRPVNRGTPLLWPASAYREAEELLSQFEVLSPNEHIVRLALRGCSAYQLPWFDSHLWAYAEYYRISQLLSEDFQHDRFYGTVRCSNPFL